LLLEAAQALKRIFNRVDAWSSRAPRKTRFNALGS
jgi:hypothetical protein